MDHDEVLASGVSQYSFLSSESWVLSLYNNSPANNPVAVEHNTGAKHASKPCFTVEAFENAGREGHIYLHQIVKYYRAFKKSPHFPKAKSSIISVSPL